MNFEKATAIRCGFFFSLQGLNMGWFVKKQPPFVGAILQFRLRNLTDFNEAGLFSSFGCRHQTFLVQRVLYRRCQFRFLGLLRLEAGKVLR